MNENSAWKCDLCKKDVSEQITKVDQNGKKVYTICIDCYTKMGKEKRT